MNKYNGLGAHRPSSYEIQEPGEGLPRVDRVEQQTLGSAGQKYGFGSRLGQAPVPRPQEIVRDQDVPFPDDSYKAGPRRMPLMIPATFMHPAAAPNSDAWDKLAGWDKPTLTLVGEAVAERGFNPQEFFDQMPGTTGQPHQVYPRCQTTSKRSAGSATLP